METTDYSYMSDIQNRHITGVPDTTLKVMSDQSQKIETKYPTDTIPLPTRGWFYPEGHPLSSGEIELKQMTAREEDILANRELMRTGKVLDKLLEALIVNKLVKYEEILIPDKNAIFLSIRRLAYGDDYPVTVSCPNCGHPNRININLSELENKPFDFDNHPRGENSFSYKLPNSGVSVTYKILNQIDEQSIDAELTQLKKLYKDVSRELTTRLKYLITSIDGVANAQVVRKFIDERLSAKDSLALRTVMRDTNPDVDMSFTFNCSNCPLEGRKMDVPIGTSFLWPSIES